MQNLMVTFRLDGTGVFSDRYEPTHIDALLMWAQSERNGMEPPARAEEPEDISIPLGRWEIGGQWGYKASALFPVDLAGEVVGYLRRRIRMDRLPYTDGGGIVTAGGEYMSKNIPIPKQVCAAMVGYCVGYRDAVLDLASDIRYIGRYTSGGIGRVIGVTVDEIEDDFSCVKDGLAMRYLPKAYGFRLCRVRPPYWNNFQRINVCEIGEKLLDQGDI